MCVCANNNNSNISKSNNTNFYRRYKVDSTPTMSRVARLNQFEFFVSAAAAAAVVVCAWTRDCECSPAFICVCVKMVYLLCVCCVSGTVSIEIDFVNVYVRNVIYVALRSHVHCTQSSIYISYIHTYTYIVQAVNNICSLCRPKLIKF